jgi:hybrid cluster-associated redox disulfide protein
MIFVAITKDQMIGEILQSNPDTAKVFRKFGMHCLGCAIASGETVEQAAQVHGLDLDDLLKALNQVAEE